MRWIVSRFKNPGRDSDKFVLRLPDGMRSLIKEVAEENGRSMNAEIVQILKRALSDEGKRE